MAVYVLNAIPVAKFVPASEDLALIIQHCDLNEVKAALAANPDFISAVGHAATAEIISAQLGVSISQNRLEVELRADDLAYAALVTLPRRLSEGERLSEDELLSAPITWVAAEIDFYP